MGGTFRVFYKVKGLLLMMVWFGVLLLWFGGNSGVRTLKLG